MPIHLAKQLSTLEKELLGAYKKELVTLDIIHQRDEQVKELTQKINSLKTENKRLFIFRDRYEALSKSILGGTQIRYWKLKSRLKAK